MPCIYKKGRYTCTKNAKEDVFTYCDFSDTRDCIDYKASNADYIRSMSDEQLATLLKYCYDNLPPDCKSRYKCDKLQVFKWLKEEYDGEIFIPPSQ